MARRSRAVAWWSSEDGRRLRRLREQRGWNQQELADVLGAGPSWISQVEGGVIKPSPERLAALEALFGPALSGPTKVPGDGAHEAVAFACLWRARADLLLLLSSRTRNRAQRLRLADLQRDLLAAASAHPLAADLVSGSRLLHLHELSQLTTPLNRILIAAEVAVMKLDAPYKTGFSASDLLELFETITQDLGLRSETYLAMRRAIEAFPRSRPRWQQLTCVGGVLGELQVAASDGSGSLAVLTGHDPVGWLGMSHVGGSWLVRSPEDAAAGKALSELGGATGTSSVLARSVLGPVLAPIAAVAAMSEGTQFDLSVEGDSPAEESLSLAVPTARRCEAMGRHWVRLEATKLTAAYAGLLAENGSALQPVPPASVSAAQLGAVSDLLKLWSDREAELSGTKSHDQNERVRELDDLRDTTFGTAMVIGQYAAGSEPSVRLHDLARELGVESRLLMAWLDERGWGVPSASSALDPVRAARVRMFLPLSLSDADDGEPLRS